MKNTKADKLIISLIRIRSPLLLSWRWNCLTHGVLITVVHSTYVFTIVLKKTELKKVRPSMILLKSKFVLFPQMVPFTTWIKLIVMRCVYIKIPLRVSAYEKIIHQTKSVCPLKLASSISLCDYRNILICPQNKLGSSSLNSSSIETKGY